MTYIYHTPENEFHEITELYCFVSVGEKEEGVIAAQINDPFGRLMMMPLVAGDKKRLEALRPIAQQIVKDQNMQVKLIRLSVREVIEEIK